MYKDTIFINCNYIPIEIISALGNQPKRVWPNDISVNVNTLLPVNYCPYSKAFMACSRNKSIKKIIATSCDAMRRIYDNLHNTFLLDVPQQQGQQQTKYFYQQLLNMISFLPGNYSDEKLISEIKKYNNKRSFLFKNINTLYNKNTKSLEVFLNNFNFYFNNPSQIKNLINKKNTKDNSRKVPVLLLSSCLLNGSIMSVMNKGGLKPVGVDSCLGERSFNFVVNINKQSPLLSLAHSYLAKPDCPRMMNPTKRLNEINKLYKDRKYEGIIYFVPKFCDQANYDFKYFKEWSQKKGIPILRIEGEYNLSNNGQLLTRVMAFKESIKLNKGV